MRCFRGRIYNDARGRLKIVFDEPLPRGRTTLLLTRVDGRVVELKFDATITNNDPCRSKCRPPPFPELRPGAVVEGVIGDELRCRLCGRYTTATINGLCDGCFQYLYAPYKPNIEGWGGVT